MSYTVDNGPSLSQVFDISGNDLDGSQVTVTAPTNYEVSLDNSTFSASVNISYTAPSLSSTTVYVRLKSGLSVGTYNIETVVCSDNGSASNKNVTVSGEVKAASYSCATDLIISEVIESGSDKYLEIANYTGARINLANYDIALYFNGNTSPSNILVFGDTNTIADQSVFVYEYLGSDNWTGTVDTSSGALSFTGNDVIALRKNTTNIDVFGTIGNSSDFYDDQIVIRNAFSNTPTTSYSSSDWNFSTYSGENPNSLGSHTMSCICETPATHASNISFSSVSSSSINLSWTNGDGIRRIVLVKQDSPVDWTPVDDNTYIANSSFASGTELGTGNYIVYNGFDNNFTIDNLTAGTNYYFEIFEYNCQDGTESYYTNGSPAQANKTTSPQEISNFQLICGSGTDAEFSWTLPSGNYDGILITGLQGGTPDDPTCDGNTLTNPLTNFSSADVYCSNGSGSVYLLNDISTNLSISGLTNGLSYTFKAFVYKNSSWSQGTEITFTAQVSDVSSLSTDCGNTTCDLSWTNPQAICYDEIIVVAHDSSSVSANPSGDGTSYSANSVFGSGTDIGTDEFIVYKGTAESCSISNLSNGTDYYYKVFVRYGTRWSSGSEVNCAPSTAIKLDYGDLAIIGINTNIQDFFTSLDAGTDEIQFICFVDITPETAIDITDNGYERGYAELWGEGEGTVRFTRKNSTIPAGTVITLRGRSIASKWHVFIGDGTDTHTYIDDDANWDITSISGNFDLNFTDQIWILQGGEWTNPTGLHNSSYSGKVLYGWTAVGWEPNPGYNDTKGSTLYGESTCSQTNVTGVPNQDKVRYYDDTTGTNQRAWISRFNDDAKWSGYPNSSDYYDADTLPDQIWINGSGFSTTAQWTGETSSDWKDCTNWLNLKVPNNTSNVIFIADDCNNDIVISAGDTVICDNLTIQGSSVLHSIKIEGASNAVLEIHGDLTINIASAFDFDDGNSSTIDGKIKIYGNWINNSGTNGFLQGNSTVEFKGSNSQTILSSDSQEDFFNLIMNNSSASGVITNKNIVVSDTISLENGIFDLNANNLTISGEYLRTNGLFKGNSSSNLTINGTGELADFNFSNPQELNTLTMNRNSQTAELSSNLTIYDLTISAGVIELSAGKNFSITNNLTNSVGASGLILKSNATGTASLLLNTENVLATCERYIQAGAWSYYFSPLSAIPKSTFSSALGMYYYQESPADYWKDHDAYGENAWMIEGNTNLSTDKAYIIYKKSSSIFSTVGGNLFFDGTTTNKQFTLTYTNSGTGAVNQDGVTSDWDVFEGWNLIGNPFSCAIDWTQVVLSDVEDVIYYYDGIAQNYKYYGTGTAYNEGITVNGGSQFVPANQAFFVKASADGGTVTIPNSARAHNSQLYMKKKNTKIPNYIKLKITDNNISDETIIIFKEDATNLHDNFDGYKFISLSENAPQIYSIDEKNSLYSINNLPILNNSTLKLGFYTKDAGEYNISFENVEIENYHVYFIDKLLNKTVNMQENINYQFFYDGNVNNNRFELSFIKNRKPIIVNALADLYKNTDEQFVINLTNNTFSDPDIGDYLTYSCSLADGTDLPETLNFENGTLTGLFSECAELEITITATDKFGLKSSQNFRLFVNNTTNTNNLKADELITMYPNPAKDVLYLYISKIMNDTKIEIYDVSGKLILSQNTSVEENTLDVSKLSEGIYILEVKNDFINEQEKLIIK